MKNRTKHMPGRSARRLFPPVALTLLLFLGQPLDALAQWTTNGNNINNTNPGNVGVGTSAPATKLDVAGVARAEALSVNGATAEKTFTVLWGNDVANQKVQVYWPASTQVDGIFEITVTGHYWYSNSNGGIRKRIVINGRNIGIINMEQSEVPFRLGFTGNSDTISDIMWDAANSRYYFVVANLDNKQNAITIHVKSITPGVTPANADGLNISAIYTTDATAYPQLFTSLMGSNVGIGTTTPGYRLDVQGGAVNASGGLCIAGICKTDWSQVGGGGGQWTTSGSNIYYNAGSVGIGTATPSQMFHVHSAGTWVGMRTTTAATGATINDGAQFGYDDAIGALIWNREASPVVFATSNAERMRVDVAGNVGIGTATPAAKLDVTGAGRFIGSGAAVGVRNTDGWTQVTAQRSGGMQAAFIAVPAAAYSVSNPYWAMGLSPDGSAGWSLDTWDGANIITRMRVLPNSGDVGIGTTSPSAARLHLYSPGNTYLRIGAPLASQSSIAFNDDSYGQDIVLYRRENTRDFTIWTATASNVLSVTQAGSVGIGTTAPSQKLDVQGGAINASGGLCIAGVCKTDWSQVGGGGGQWAASGSDIYFNTGNVGIGTGSPNQKLSVAGTGAFYNSTPVTPSGVRGLFMGNYSGGSSIWSYNYLSGAGDPLSVAAQDINLSTYVGGNGVSRLFISNNGNVGVGTTPSTKLHVSTATVTDGFRLDGNNSTWAALLTNLGGGSYNNITLNGDRGIVYGGAGAGNTGGGFVIVPWASAASGIRLDPSGNVGVGTASPVSKFDVGGALHVSGVCGSGVPNAQGGYMSWNQLTCGTGEVDFINHQGGGGGGFWFANTANGSSLTSLMFISGGGNVGIGTNSPAYKLDVAGNVNATGTISGGNIVARYQDVAEWVPSVQKLSAGTVVVLDALRSNHVLASSVSYDTRVAGVVSASPGVILGEGGAGKLMVATTGRVKVRVDATRARVRIGDLLVTSDTEGVAMKSEPVTIGGRQFHAPGTLIGKALEPLDKGVGEILVLLSLQ